MKSSVLNMRVVADATYIIKDLTLNTNVDMASIIETWLKKNWGFISLSLTTSSLYLMESRPGL